VERSSASRHISAVTRDFQRAPQVVLVLSVSFGHSYPTHIAYYYLFIFVGLAIINIILATLKIMMMTMMMTLLALFVALYKV